MTDALLTVAEVADRFKVSTSTVRRWIRSGRLKTIPYPGAGHRIAPDDMWTEDSERKPDDDAE